MVSCVLFYMQYNRKGIPKDLHCVVYEYSGAQTAHGRPGEPCEPFPKKWFRRQTVHITSHALAIFQAWRP